MQRTTLFSAALAAGLLIGAPAVVTAQESAGNTPAVAAAEPRDEGMDWGWLGLLGLLGLAGLAGRKRDRNGTAAHTRPVDRPGATTPPRV